MAAEHVGPERHFLGIFQWQLLDVLSMLSCLTGCMNYCSINYQNSLLGTWHNCNWPFKQTSVVVVNLVDGVVLLFEGNYYYYY